MSSRTHTRRLAATSVLVFLFFGPPSLADRDATRDCESRGRTFATEIATLYALSTCYAARSADEDREYFAAILHTVDGFLFVVGAGRQGLDEVSLRFERLDGETFVALWHTHGAPGAHRDLFSPTDTALVKKVGVPFYLTDPKGGLRVFRPGDKVRAPPRDRLTIRSPTGASAGTVLATNLRASPIALRDR